MFMPGTKVYFLSRALLTRLSHTPNPDRALQLTSDQNELVHWHSNKNLNLQILGQIVSHYDLAVDFPRVTGAEYYCILLWLS